MIKQKSILTKVAGINGKKKTTQDHSKIIWKREGEGQRTREKRERIERTNKEERGRER